MDRPLIMLPHRQRAVTLIELLVVLGILLMVAALGISAFRNSGRANRLAAVESTVLGALRDAQNAARTTGNPVTLTISQPSADVAPIIQGVGRTPLWEFRCRGDDFIDTSRFATLPTLGGPTGGDSILQTALRQRDGLLGDCLAINPVITQAPAWWLPAIVVDDGKDPRSLLFRGKRNDGFILRCTVRFPSSFEGGVKPLLTLSTESPHAPGIAFADDLMPPTLTKGLAGLFLRPSHLRSYEVSQPHSITVNGWELVGWVATAGGVAAVGSVVDNAGGENGAHLDWTQPDSNTDTAMGYLARLHNIFIPLRQEWHEVALIYSGSSILLTCDGRQVSTAKTVTLDVSRANSLGGPLHLFVGHVQRGDWSQEENRQLNQSGNWYPYNDNDPAGAVNGGLRWDRTKRFHVPGVVDCDYWLTTNPPPPHFFILDSTTRITDIACLRLTSGQTYQLPGNTTLASPIGLTVLPDGRVLGSPTSGGKKQFQITGVTADMGDAAVFSITDNGQVTGTVKPARTAP